MDYISREAAIEAIENTDWYHINHSGELVHGANSNDDTPLYKADDVYKAIDAVLAADVVERKTGKWIPCSEVLPKKDGRYQVTRHDYVTQTNFVDILWYEEGVWWNRQSIGDYAVTAWMPLSEPYKEEQE